MITLTEGVGDPVLPEVSESILATSAAFGVLVFGLVLLVLYVRRTRRMAAEALRRIDEVERNDDGRIDSRS